MTQMEFLNAVIAIATDNAEITEHANAEIAKIHAKNEKAAAKRAEKSAENAPLIEKIMATVGETPMTASDFKDILGVSVQKTSAILRKLALDEQIGVVEVKIPKKGIQKGYVAL